MRKVLRVATHKWVEYLAKLSLIENLKAYLSAESFILSPLDGKGLRTKYLQIKRLQCDGSKWAVPFSRSLCLPPPARLQLGKYIKLSSALRCHELNAKDSRVGRPQVAAVSLASYYSPCSFPLFRMPCCICMQFAFVFCSLYSFHLAHHLPLTRALVHCLSNRLTSFLALCIHNSIISLDANYEKR